LLVTAFTLGIIAPKVLPHLEWIAWTSLVLATLASSCWYFSLRITTQAADVPAPPA
jgi:hypothetical protein